MREELIIDESYELAGSLLECGFEKEAKQQQAKASKLKRKRLQKRKKRIIQALLKEAFDG